MMTKKEIARKERDERIILITKLEDARIILNSVAYEAVDGIYIKVSDIIHNLGNLEREVRSVLKND